MPYVEMGIKRLNKQQFKESNTVTKLVLIAKKAKEDKGAKFTSLMYLLDEEYMRNCFDKLEKRKAAGVDGRTVESYGAKERDAMITQTIQQLKGHSYQPQPVRGVEIQKDKGHKRMLGIPTVKDKMVQMAAARILSSIYETTFLESSYGYRTGRDAHACLKEVNHMIMQQKVNYIIDADIKGFFDNIDHATMMRCLEQRISDPHFKQLIGKMLKSGIMTEGLQQKTEKGTPQGGIISPVLANIYLHYVLDLWMEVRERKKMKGYIKHIRYADDFIIGVQYKEEAEQLQRDIQVRLKTFRLELSAEKTKVIEFGRFSEENRRRKKHKRETFTFLGFTHYNSKTRDGRYQLRVKTSKKKMKVAIAETSTYLKTHRTHRMEGIWEILKLKLTGHYNYYGVSGNIEQLKQYHQKTRALAFKWLNRRSDRKSFNWEEFEERIRCNPLPLPKLTYAIYNTW